MAYIDTHCHLDIVEGKDAGIPEILEKAYSDNVQAIIQIATSFDSSVWNQNLIQSYSNRKNTPELYYSIGIHPEYATPEDSEKRLSDLIAESYPDPAFVAIGECGLDFFHSPEKRTTQQRTFEMQIEQAHKLKLPLILHLRDDRSYNPERLEAMQLALEMVRSAGSDLRGVLHCYTYSYDEALPFVDMGWKVSFSGIVTYKNAGVVRDAAANLPLECLMTETDAPYLTPVPHRGKPNTPAYVGNTAEFIAELRSEGNPDMKDTIIKSLETNAREFIGWKNHA